MTIRFFGGRVDGFSPENSWVQNRGAACTSASLLIGLGLLGVPGLPSLGEACRLFGAPVDFGAPALLDYVGLPGRRAPLDVRVEAVAAARGRAVRSRTGIVLPYPPPRPRSAEVLVVHLLYGQERPGAYGYWGFRLLDRRTWDTGGHSVVLLGTDERGGWRVLDPNWPGVQEWPRPGVAVTVTRLSARATP